MNRRTVVVYSSYTDVLACCNPPEPYLPCPKPNSKLRLSKPSPRGSTLTPASTRRAASSPRRQTRALTLSGFRWVGYHREASFHLWQEVFIPGFPFCIYTKAPDMEWVLKYQKNSLVLGSPEYNRIRQACKTNKIW